MDESFVLPIVTALKGIPKVTTKERKSPEGAMVFSVSGSSDSNIFYWRISLNPQVTEDGDIVYIFPELQVM